MSIKITEIKNTKEYVRPFSKQMKTIVVIVVIASMIIGGPIVWSSGGKPFSPLINLFLIVQYLIVWGYLSLLLFMFYRNTHLREYVLHIHTMWLTGLITFPITFLLSRFLPLIKTSIGTDIYIVCTFISPGLWLAIYLIGKIINKQNMKLFEVETQENASLWQDLFRMTSIDIALLRFPKHK
jgi:hypothetical protein